MITFSKDCVNMKGSENHQLEQVQQIVDTEEKDRSLKLFTGETYNSLSKAVMEEMVQSEGATFLSQQQEIGMPIQFIIYPQKVCVTPHQSKYVSEQVEEYSVINVGTMTQEMEINR